MTNDFQYLLTLLGCALSGDKADMPDERVSWDNVFRIAKEQSVYPMLIYALNKQPELIGIEHNLGLKNEQRSSFIAETVRREASFRIIEALLQGGVVSIVLKGYSLSTLYPEPLMRQSGDLDLYVGLDSEIKAQDVLRAKGAIVQERAGEAQECSCSYPPVGHIELHAWLLGKADRTAWLSENPTGITQEYKQIVLKDGQRIYTLGDMDNMVFLSLHFIKHFIKYGASIRHIFDIGLFYQKFANECDISQFWEKMKRLQFVGIIRAVLSCCVYYCGMQKGSLAGFELLDRETVDFVLSDIEAGGWMGLNEKQDRNTARLIYEKALYDRSSSAGNIGYLWSKRKSLWSLVAAVVCPREQLYAKYGYAGKLRFLVPVAYIHRMIDGCRKLLRGQIKAVVINTSKKQDDISQRRVELFKTLGILK